MIAPDPPPELIGEIAFPLVTFLLALAVALRCYFA
jgi:hypothetical protein